MSMVFHGEVQLAGWSESHSGGCKVTFWLADPSELDAFRTLTVRKGNMAGQILACALAEIADEPTPVATEDERNDRARAQLDAAPTARPILGPLAMWCVLRCKEPEFQSWLGVADEAGARLWVLKACDIDSRRDIDGAAAELFKRVVLKPYSEHREAAGVLA